MLHRPREPVNDEDFCRGKPEATTKRLLLYPLSSSCLGQSSNRAIETRAHRVVPSCQPFRYALREELPTIGELSRVGGSATSTDSGVFVKVDYSRLSVYVYIGLRDVRANLPRTEILKEDWG